MLKEEIKIGLADLIPELQSTLIEEYRKDLPDLAIYQVNRESMFLYVPDFSREIKSKEEISKMTPQEKIKEIQAIINEAEKRVKTIGKSLKKGEITLENFSSIDKEVGALERQKMANIIAKQQETETGKNNEEISVSKESEEQGEDDNISL